MDEFIAQCWFMVDAHRLESDTVDWTDAPYVWAAVDAQIHQDAGYYLRDWISTRLDSLPKGTFEDDTLQEIRLMANEYTLGRDS